MRLYWHQDIPRIITNHMIRITISLRRSASVPPLRLSWDQCGNSVARRWRVLWKMPIAFCVFWPALSPPCLHCSKAHGQVIYNVHMEDRGVKRTYQIFWQIMHESISGVKKNLKGLVNVISIRCIGHFCYSKPSQLGAGCRRGYIHGRYSHSGHNL